MGTTSLILGLDDVVDNLTETATENEGLRVLRGCFPVVIMTLRCHSTLRSRVQWAVLRLCRIFAEQNPTHIVGAIWSRLEEEGIETLWLLRAIPRAPWVLATPARPPWILERALLMRPNCPPLPLSTTGCGHLRETCSEAERVLLIGYDVARFSPLFEHADVHLCTVDSEQTIEAPAALSSGSFDHHHVSTAMSHPALRVMSVVFWRSLRHGGQLHLVSSTHHNAMCFEAYLKPTRVVAAYWKPVGFEMRGHLRDPGLLLTTIEHGTGPPERRKISFSLTQLQS